MRLGIIGLGRAGAVHLQACKAVPGLEVGAVCDPAAAARRTATATGIKAYSDLERMLASEPLDVVSVCAPPADHAALTIACLERGLHVLCEKPLALSASDGQKMLDAAQRHDRQLLVASKFRHVREVLYLQHLVRSGDLGRPASFEVSFCSPVDMSKRWNAQPQRAGGGVIVDNGCHAFDIISFLFDSVTRVHATQLKPVQRLPVEDSASLRVWAGDGVIGNVDLSWSWTTGRDTYLIVRGTRGTVEIGWRKSQISLDGKRWRKIGGPYDKLEAHRRMYTALLETISEGRRPWITPADCVGVVATVEAAYRSLRSGSWERIGSEADGADDWEAHEAAADGGI
jgi:predicted dehydrogenase